MKVRKKFILLLSQPHSPWRSFFCRSFSCKVLLAGYFANWYGVGRRCFDLCIRFLIAHTGTEYISYKERSYKTFMVLSQNRAFLCRDRNSYRRALQGFMKARWVAFVIVFACVGIIFIAENHPSELAPLEDRNRVRTSITLPEGTDSDYTDKVAYNITKDSWTQFLKNLSYSLLLLVFEGAEECSLYKYGSCGCKLRERAGPGRKTNHEPNISAS